MKKIFIITVFSALCSCHPQSGDRGQDEGSENANSSMDQVELSNEQMEHAGIKTGQLSKKQMNKEVPANGTLRLLPEYLASVSPFVAGYVEKINCREGSFVQKGAVLASLKHPDYIQLQQDFLEAAGRFDYLNQELERQKTLSEANVNAQKQYQQARADQEAARARYFSVREKLKFLGISPDSVRAGHIQHTISLKASISGIVAKVNVHKGELADPQRVAFEIQDDSRLYASLGVFEKDVNQIHNGETFVFSVPAFGDSLKYHGKITGIDRMLDPETKTMKVTGEIEPSDELIPGLYIEARIQSPEKEVYALPEEAVVQDRNAANIFIYTGKQKEASGDESAVFKKIRIKTGMTGNGFLQVLSPEPLLNNKDIVLSGAFFLKAEMNKGEGDED